MHGGEVREIIGAVDETFLERMILVFMDLLRAICCWKRWQTIAPIPRGKRWWRSGLQALGTGVLYLVSDRAKALIQLAEQGLGVPEYARFLSCHA